MMKSDNYRITRSLKLSSTMEGYNITSHKFIGGFGCIETKFYENISLSSIRRFYQLSHSWTTINDDTGKILSFYEASKAYNRNRK